MQILIKSFAFHSKVEMAQMNIYSMFKKAIDRLGTPVKTNAKNGLCKPIQNDDRTGNPNHTDDRLSNPGKNNANNGLGKSIQNDDRTGKPNHTDDRLGTPADNSASSRLGNPTSVEDRTGNPVQTESHIEGMKVRDAFKWIMNMSRIMTDDKKRKATDDLSSEHKNKIQKKSDTSNNERSFLSSWLETFNWLKFENGAMFCSLRMAHSSNVCKFTRTGSTNFRLSTLQDHEISRGHIQAIKLF
jgi:hypothetical protein